MRISIELALSGCLAEARSILRDGVECVAHAHFILSDPKLQKVWLSEYDGRRRRKHSNRHSSTRKPHNCSRDLPNFWPLRSFADLADVNLQVHHWLEGVANRRRHRVTGQTPEKRFRPEALHLLPTIAPDYRDTAEALVHKDLRFAFDGNHYCVPPRYVGCALTVKADASALMIYDQHQKVASYARCWQRGQVLGVEHFQKGLLAQKAAAQRSAAQQRMVAWLGPTCELYLRRLAETDRCATMNFPTALN